MPALYTTQLPDDQFQYALANEEIDTSLELVVDGSLLAMGRSLELGWVIIGEDTLFWNACVAGGGAGPTGPARWRCY